jgi:acetyl-CoA carboxylase biotin carboxyl carrier protein
MKKIKEISVSPPEEGMPPKIDYEEIAKIVKLIEDHGLAEFELEIEGFKIKLRKNAPAMSAGEAGPRSGPDFSGPTASPASPAGDESGPGFAANTAFVTSPIVGTFYRAPSPTSPPFVEIGDPVKKKQILCIVEAMKLMNEIESEADGIVKEIFVENGKPVEYGQKLFAIAPFA